MSTSKKRKKLNKHAPGNSRPAPKESPQTPATDAAEAERFWSKWAVKVLSFAVLTAIIALLFLIKQQADTNRTNPATGEPLNSLVSGDSGDTTSASRVFRSPLESAKGVDLSKYNIDATAPTYSEGVTVYEFKPQFIETAFTKNFKSLTAYEDVNFDENLNNFVDEVEGYFSLLENIDYTFKTFDKFELIADDPHYRVLNATDQDTGLQASFYVDIDGNQQVSYVTSFTTKEHTSGDVNIEDIANDIQVLTGYDLTKSDIQSLMDLAVICCDGGTSQSLVLSALSRAFTLQVQLYDNNTDEEAWVIQVARSVYSAPSSDGSYFDEDGNLVIEGQDFSNLGAGNDKEAPGVLDEDSGTTEPQAETGDGAGDGEDTQIPDSE